MEPINVNNQQKPEGPPQIPTPQFSYSNYPVQAPGNMYPQAPENYPPAGTTQGVPPVGMAGATGLQPPPQPQPDFGMYYQPVVKKPKEPYAAKKEDGWLAIGCMVLGFLFIRWLFENGNWNGLGTGIFTTLFVGIVVLYAKIKKIEFSKESWFWLAVLQATGASYFIWPLEYLEFYRALFLFGSAVYWCASLFGTLLENKTSNYIFIDAVNSLFIIPFRNFALYFKSIPVFAAPKKDGEKKKTLFYVIFGLALCIPALAILLPLLLKADNGNFHRVLKDFVTLLEKIFSDDISTYIWEFIFSIPVFLYICGLIAGSAHKRYTTQFTKEKVNATAQKLKLIPEISIYVLMGVIIGFYLLFIACQIPYFFSAFLGVRPAGYQVYSAYAREGFFELCTIAGINLAFLIGAHLFTRKQQNKNNILRIFTIIISIITILLLGTAFSKMALYIGAYGLSTKRIITCLFMLFLAIVFIGIIVFQFKKFPIVQFFVLLGSALFCLLLFSGVDDIVIRYNMNAYLNGNISDFDTCLLYDASYFGVRDVANSISLFNKEKQEEIELKIYYRVESSKDRKWSIEDTINDMLFRNDKELNATSSK